MKEISRKRFGYHVVYDSDIYDAINFAHKNGFGYIVPDLMIPRFFPECFNFDERRKIKDSLRNNNVSISFHGPSDYLNMGTLYPEVRKAILERLKLCLEFALDVEAKRFTIHIDPQYGFSSSGKKGTYLEDHWDLYKNAIKQSLVKLIEYSQGKVDICIENNSFNEMTMELLNDVLPKKNLYLSWDIIKGYTNELKPNLEIEKFFQENLEKVKECHLHDKKSGKSSHDLLGLSNINFSKYLQLLLTKDVYFTLEIRPRTNAVRSLNKLRNTLLKLGYNIV